MQRKEDLPYLEPFHQIGVSFEPINFKEAKNKKDKNTVLARKKELRQITKVLGEDPGTLEIHSLIDLLYEKLEIHRPITDMNFPEIKRD